MVLAAVVVMSAGDRLVTRDLAEFGDVGEKVSILEIF